MLSLVVAAGVYAWSSTREKVYESTAEIDTIAGSTTGGKTLTQEEVDIITGRNAALVSTTSLQRKAIEQSGLDLSVAIAGERLSTTESSSPGFLSIVATGPTPSEAQALARGAAEALVTRNQEAENEVALVSPASKPTSPVSPQPARDAALAFLAALVVNAELAALLGRVAGRLDMSRIGDQLRETGAPVLAFLTGRSPHDAVEAFRELRASVFLAPEPVRSVAVIEGEPRWGGTLVALGLAQASANAAASVVLVDANLRAPTVAAAMGLPQEPGLADVLRGSPLDSVLRANPAQPEYRVLVAGGGTVDAPGRLGSGSFQKVLAELEQESELVVALSPAVSIGVDAFVIAAQCDAVILVLNARRSTRRSVRAVVDRLARLDVQVLGSVVTRVRLSRDEERRILAGSG